MSEESKRLRLYLIRHGEISGAEAGKVYGQTDFPLSEKGIQQSQRLADTLAEARLSAVYSSDLIRAVRTAEIIAAPHQLTVQIRPAFREIDMGLWEGLSLADLYRQNEESVKRLFENPESFQYPNGESFAAFAIRIRAAFEELRTTHPNQDVALITHGGATRAIIGTALEMPMRTWLRLAQGYGCANLIDWYDDSPVLQSLNVSPP